jgi:RNA polymerase sigma-70 factor (ECF subfamily)
MEIRNLLQRCVQKDREAWNEFVRQYQGLVTRSVLYKLKKLNFPSRKQEYRDIVQEIFTSIWEKDKLSKLKNPNCLKGWLAIVSLNFTVNYCQRKVFKKAKRTFSLENELANESPGFTLSSILSSEKLRTEKMIEANELKSMINAEISKLVPKQQLALKLSIFDGKTQKDISSIMNVPGGTVATLISRAKKQLRARLEKIMGQDFYV